MKAKSCGMPTIDRCLPVVRRRPLRIAGIAALLAALLLAVIGCRASHGKPSATVLSSDPGGPPGLLAPSRGAPDGRVAITVFEDYQ